MKKQKKIIPVAFNMSFGLIPVIVCMVLSKFIADRYSLYLCMFLGIIYSFLSFYISRKKIYNFVLYISTAALFILSLSTFLPIQMFPRGTIPFILEILIFLLMGLMFYGRQLLKKLFLKKNSFSHENLIVRSLDSSMVSAQIIFYVISFHFLIILLAYILIYPLSETTKIFLFYISPPLLFIICIGINQIGIHFVNRIMNKEEEIPVVNEKGDVIGKRFKSEIPVYKNSQINPVIRIAIIYNGKLFLSLKDCICSGEKNKIDLPIGYYLKYGESLEEGITHAVKEVYPDPVSFIPRFSIKHHFTNKEVNLLIYLYLAYIEDESLLLNSNFLNGKLWTFSQIEQNLGKGYFCECFEQEYEHLKSSVEIWEQFK